MKKIALIITTLFVVISSINAQSPVNLGVKIGFNSTKMQTEFKNVNDITDQAKTGFLAGAFIRLNLPVFYIQPEIYFSKKGGNFQSATIPQFNNMVLTQQTVINTIDVPILIGKKLINMSVFNFRVMAGPVISFVSSKDVSYQINGIAQAINSGTSVTTAFKDKIWGIQVGAGIDILKFTLDIRYEWGLNNISDSPDMNIKTKLLNVSLGMKIL